MPQRNFTRMLAQTASEWSNDKAPRLGAALAFYSALSIGPLLVLSIAVAGFLFGKQAASGRLVHQMSGLIGKDGAVFIQMVLANSHQPKEGIIATVISVAVLLFSASGVFGELQDALNTIWKIAPKPRGTFVNLLRSRFLSFAMILGTGFLLLISLSINAALGFVGDSIFAYMPASATVLMILNAVMSFLVVTGLFATIFKFLPDTRVLWRDVWTGALITAILFTLGKYLIGLYLGHSAISSTYGAAGSLIVFLVWIYYSAQILYFGAEFTYVYAGNKPTSP